MPGPLQKPRPFRRKGKKLPGQSTDDELGLDLRIRVIDRPSSTIINEELVQVGNIGAGDYIEISSEGLSIFRNSVLHVSLQDDGDLFLGRDLSDPAKTEFVVFSNSQTYNEESIGAGDMLLGDNSTGKKNMLWDASDGSIKVRTGVVVRGKWQSDGDMFLGSDLSAPATTYLSIFATNQTYNTESVKAGDMLIGNNSASKANIFWDESVSQLKFRGGKITQLYIDTDGTLVAGAGDVQLDSDGLTLNPGTQGTKKIKVDDGGVLIAELYGFTDPGVSSQLTLIGRGRGGSSPITHEGLVEIIAITDDGAAHAGAASVSITLDTDHNLCNVVAGTFRAKGAIFNELGQAVDFRIESDVLPSIFFVDGSANSIGINTLYPDIHAILDMHLAGKPIILPVLTSTQQAAVTPTEGMLCFNTTTNTLEFHNGAAWKTLAGV